MRYTTSKIYGDKSEQLAIMFLIEEGFSILEHNYFARKMGELDIIASRDGVVHFIEVKSARADFDPIYNLTPSKLKKVTNSAQYYMKNKNLDMPFVVDAIIIRLDELEFIENITI